MTKKENHRPLDYKLAKLFILTVKQFFENTTLHGFKYLVLPGLTTLEKALWYFIQLLALIASVYIFLHALEGFSAKPTVTSLHSVKHPVWEVPFPAVAVCSVNKISKKAAWEYAEYLATKTNNYSVEWFFKNIRYLGRLFDLGIEDYDEYVKFQDVLDEIDFNNVTKVYDSQETVIRLSPQCEDLLVRCQWGISEANCSEIFNFRKTREGYCCVFNYVRQFGTLSEEDVVKPKFTGFTGSDAGLLVILNSSMHDYYYPIRHTVGFNVFVFRSSDFPDAQTGGLVQLFVNPDTETFFKLDVTTIQSTTDTLQYSAKQRGCLFEHELYKQYAGHYSFADCLLKCKIRSILALCGCMPFFLPTNFPDGTTSDLKCTLAHNICMNRYKATVNTFWPSFVDTDDSQKTTEDLIECPDCLPICSKSNYRITATYSKTLTQTLENSPWPLLKNLPTFNDISIVRVYYPFIASTLYQTDVVMTWQEIVSSFGGLLGLCLGFSLISLVEILYYATVKLYQNIPEVYNLRNNEEIIEKSKISNKPSLVQALSKAAMKEIYVDDFSKYRRNLFKSRN